MRLDLATPRILSFVGGMLLVTLGASILLVKPRHRPNVALAAFVAGLGAYNSTGLFVRDDPVSSLVLGAAQGAFAAVGLWGLVALVISFPTRMKRDSTAVLASLAFAFSMSLTVVEEFPWSFPLYARTWPSLSPAYIAERLLIDAFYAALPAAVVLLAHRHLRLSRSDPEAATKVTLLAAGLTIYVGFLGGAGGSEGLKPFSGDWVGTVDVLSFLVPMLAATSLWLAGTTGQNARASRNLALLSAAMMLTGSLYKAFADNTGGYGIVRAATAVILAWAILRYQLLGLDVKIRWGLSKGTVAAIFLAMFFVGAQVAQNWFGSSYGPLFGGITAGILLFAISPIQRMAERFATVAVPVSTVGSVMPPTPPVTTGKEEAYRAALRAALRDHKLTRQDEVGLAHLSDELGLTHKRAREIWHEVDLEMSGGLGKHELV